MLIAVTLGALGAHFFKSKISPEQLITYETAVRYMIYHAFGILLVGISFHHGNKNRLKWVFILFCLGIMIFSGSVFLLSLKSFLGIESWSLILGPITPLGGLCFISGWLFFMLSFNKKSHE